MNDLESRRFACLIQVSQKLSITKNDFQGFGNDEFEAAKCSMVIHHLVKTNENGVVDDWSPIGEAFSEAFRVLKPGGVFVVAFSTPEQRGGNW